MSEQPQTTDPRPSDEVGEVDESAALERAKSSIREARDAEAEVESHGDIPAEGDRRAEG